MSSPAPIAHVAILWPGGTRPATVMPSLSITVPPSSWVRAMTTLSRAWMRMVGVVIRSTFDAAALDLVPAPLDAEPGQAGRHRVPVLDRKAAGRHGVQLRDVLDPGRARHGGGQAGVQLHQEVR